MTDRLDLHQLVHQLTEPHQHREPYEYEHLNDGGSTTRYQLGHITHQPSLLDQVWGTVGTRGQGGEVGATAPTSKPSANLDAIDCAATIDLEAARWIRDLGEDDPLDTAGCIRRLHALTASVDRCHRGGPTRTDTGRVDCCPWHAIEVDVRSWWVRARVLTGWDTAAVRLDGTCPLCGEHGSVRVRYSSQLATCTVCRETWDEASIGMLAEHIRMEAEAERFAPSPASSPVVCRPMSDLEADDLRLLPHQVTCPDCGSWSCVKVLDMPVRRLRRAGRRAG